MGYRARDTRWSSELKFAAKAFDASEGKPLILKSNGTILLGRKVFVREVMSRFYTAAPDGYCGDEDNGQTSAWYVFSAMGFYPVCPGSDELALGSPLFDNVVVHRPDGKSFSIVARGNSEQNVYVSGMKLNGRTWDRNYVRLGDLRAGAKIVFDMSSTPCYTRGTASSSRPSSMSQD